MFERLRLRFRKWKMENRFNELDMDMLLTNMTYQQYQIEYDRLTDQHDNIN